jgi:hypothetical protein
MRTPCFAWSRRTPRTRSDVRKSQIGDDQRLGIDLAIHRAGEDLAEAIHVDVALVEDCLAQVRAGTGRVITVRQHIDKHGNLLEKRLIC